MLNGFLITTFFLVFSQSIYGQTNEFKLTVGSELPTRSWFRTKLNNFNKFEHEKLRTLPGFSLNINYSRLIHSKLGIYTTVQSRISQQRYYQPILEQSGTQVAELDIQLNRMDLFIGGFKRFEIYEGKLGFDLGLNIGKRFYLNDGENYIQDSEKPTINNWITHTYEFQAFQNKFYDNDLNLLRKFRGRVEFEILTALYFQLNKKLALNFSTVFSPNHYTFYDYSYTLYYYQNSSPTPTGIYNYSGIGGGKKFVVKDFYIRTGLGLAYRF